MGLFFAPVQAKAGFFSSLFGTDVSADAEEINSTEDIDKTSQSRDLSLQANVSSALVDDKDLVKEGTNVNIVSDNALLPSTSVVGGADGGDVSSDQISVYVIRKDDSISKIAEMFDVSENTILWANDMKKGDKLVEGNVLVILPISGVKHTVLKGQTLKGIAKKYNIDVVDIAGFNGIATDEKLTVGDELIIPDAEISDEGSDEVSPKSSSKDYYQKNSGKDLGGYFINPVPNYKRLSQGIHARNGIDIAAKMGVSVLATANGRVLIARPSGWNGGFGEMIIIQHPNGAQTLYAHLSKVAVRSGDQVKQGQVIGNIGSTGRSTGPHLHYEERNTGVKNTVLRYF